MKTTVKMTCLAVLLSAGVISSCKKTEEMSNMSVRMTDAPGAFQQVNVEIIGLEVQEEGKGWITLPMQPGVYDLLSLQNGLSTLLVTKNPIPAGKINQLRMLLGSNNTVVTADEAFTLKVPGGAETGLKVNINQEVDPGKTIEILLDFDAGASVVTEGNGTFSLKPVISLKSVAQF